MGYYMDRARAHRTYEVWTFKNGKPVLHKAGTWKQCHAAAERLTSLGKAAEIVQAGGRPMLATL